VLVLGANPGWGESDAAWQSRHPDVLQDNLNGTQPMMWLTEATNHSPGVAWWRSRCLKDLLEAHPLEYLAEAVCGVDFHAYHSVRWTALPVTLPTQHFAFGQVRRQLDADAVVVITRAERAWKVAVPKLIDHERVIQTRSPQQSRLSSKNLGLEQWRVLTRALRR
jgi:hypothetical protein